MVQSAQSQVRVFQVFQDSLFFFASRILFLITLLQNRVLQAGNKHESHSYAATSSMPANAVGFRGFGFCEYRSLLHAGSRHVLHVLHAGFVHARCTQSVQRAAFEFAGNSRLHLLSLQAWQHRRRHPWQRNDSASEATAFSLRCFC